MKYRNINLSDRRIHRVGFDVKVLLEFMINKNYSRDVVQMKIGTNEAFTIGHYGNIKTYYTLFYKIYSCLSEVYPRK